MAASFVASATAEATLAETESLDVSIPASVQDGDLLLLATNARAVDVAAAIIVPCIEQSVFVNVASQLRTDNTWRRLANSLIYYNSTPGPNNPYRYGNFGTIFIKEATAADASGTVSVNFQKQTDLYTFDFAQNSCFGADSEPARVDAIGGLIVLRGANLRARYYYNYDGGEDYYYPYNGQLSDALRRLDPGR